MRWTDSLSPQKLLLPCWQVACCFYLGTSHLSPPQVYPFEPPLGHSHSPNTLSLRQLSEIKATWQISSLICLLLFCFLLPLDFCPSLFVFPLFLVLAALISGASISTFSHCLRSRRNWAASMTTKTTTTTTTMTVWVTGQESQWHSKWSIEPSQLARFLNEQLL